MQATESPMAMIMKTANASEINSPNICRVIVVSSNYFIDFCLFRRRKVASGSCGNGCSFLTAPDAQLFSASSFHTRHYAQHVTRQTALGHYGVDHKADRANQSTQANDLCTAFFQDL